MKILVTESQLRNLVKRQKNKRKKEVEEAASLTSPSTSNQSGNYTDPVSTDPSTSEDNGKSMSALEYPAYPEVGHWESGVTRGPANPIGLTKWSETVGSKITRGKANPLK